MIVTIFKSDGGPSAAEGFQNWQEANRHGFYINMKTDRRGMLHKTDCRHVGAPGEWDTEAGDVARKTKVCGAKRSDVVEWAEDGGFELIDCSDCDPRA